ncbi:hypothetical protein CROQUDRAFT_665673 [Cronartium quercuum f. sp. fusiforme G11]|uniref:Uncharacterized protein n=1 Tax=Cronartium quercuum f. sp. fusiforme G11 TaxID=708437 RepID=A0A9P6N9T5_9BASI|nr:hypothetical protein CROQUDRAFT_665673 [Cronartium quercuum f. sp. fusiforme G11]
MLATICVLCLWLFLLTFLGGSDTLRKCTSSESRKLQEDSKFKNQISTISCKRQFLRY